jgi:hypothetical protein
VEQPATSDISPTIYSTLWELLVHIIVATGVFAVIALAAVSLEFLVSWLSKIGASILVQWGLELAEYFLYVVDLSLFLVFVSKTALRTLKRL